MRASQDLHEGRLAGAVLPQQGGDLARPELEVQIIDALTPSKRLRMPRAVNQGGGAAGTRAVFMDSGASWREPCGTPRPTSASAGACKRIAAFPDPSPDKWGVLAQGISPAPLSMPASTGNGWQRASATATWAARTAMSSGAGHKVPNMRPSTMACAAASSMSWPVMATDPGASPAPLTACSTPSDMPSYDTRKALTRLLFLVSAFSACACAGSVFHLAVNWSSTMRMSPFFASGSSTCR
jgi:hypothetical protein